MLPFEQNSPKDLQLTRKVIEQLRHTETTRDLLGEDSISIFSSNEGTGEVEGEFMAETKKIPL